MDDDREAIRETLARCARLFDAGDAYGWAQLFTVQGTLTVGTNSPIVGREALQTFLEGLDVRGGRHFALNEIITIDGTTARCRSAMLTTKANPATVVATGVYDDEFVKSGDEWLVSARHLVLDE